MFIVLVNFGKDLKGWKSEKTILKQNAEKSAGLVSRLTFTISNNNKTPAVTIEIHKNTTTTTMMMMMMMIATVEERLFIQLIKKNC